MAPLAAGAHWDVTIRELWATGAGCAISITGEPGIGKTTLLARVVERTAVADDDVLRIAWTAAEGAVAWGGLVSLIGQFDDPEIDALQPAHAAGLRTACGEPLAPDAPGFSDPLTIAPTVAAALRTLLRSRAATRPTVLALDDLHWADPATAAALAAALRHLVDEPLLVIAATRPILEPVIDLERLYGGRFVGITPPPLVDHQVVAILREQGIDCTLPMLDDVMALGGGNPLHTRLLADEIAAHGWTAGHLPASIAIGHMRRLEPLDDSTRDVLAHAALHGNPDGEVIARALNSCGAAPDVDAALLAAERLGLIDGDRFVHPTIPAAIIEATGRRRRRMILRSLGESLPVGDEMRAVHLAAAVDASPDEALANELDGAASQALARGARNEAGERWLRAAQLTPQSASGDRWRRELSAADAFWGAGNLSAADEPSQRAFDAASSPPERAIAGGIRLHVLAGLDDMVGAHRFVVDLLDELDGWPMLRGMLGRARVRLEQIVDLHRALSTAETLTDEMHAAGLTAAATEFEIAASNCRYVIGDPVDPRQLWALGGPSFDATDFISAGWMALEVLVWSGVDDHATTSALDHVERAARSAGSMQSLAKLHDFRANHLLRLGQWAEAETEARRAVDLAELTRSTSSMAAGALSWALAATGRFDQARAALAESSVAVPDEQLPLFVAAHAASAGFIELCAGNWNVAAALLEQAWHAADKMGMGDLTAMPFRVDLIEALVMSGRLADAEERARQLSELAQRNPLPSALVQVERADVLVMGASGDVDAAVGAFERAESLFEQIEIPFERARMALGLGTLMRRRGRRSEAGRRLGDAAATFRHLGAEPFLQRAEQELSRLGRARPGGLELTPTERMVAELVVAGASNADVANELIVSTRTVEANLTRIYRKLGIRSRSQLVAAFHEGLTRPAESVDE